jgi:hypothetical protein
VDLKKDTCCVITEPGIGHHGSFEVSRLCIWENPRIDLNHPSVGTCVRRSGEVGVQSIGSLEDRIPLQFGIAKCDIPTTTKIVWATRVSEVDRWHTISEFGKSKVPKQVHQDSRSCEVRNPDRGDEDR